jgi:hypothetical protein
MPGSPIKRARLSQNVPNLSDRRLLHPVPSRSREAVPDDVELAMIAKRVLLDVAENGENENARVGAARALLDATRLRPSDSASMDQKRFSDELERMPAAELASLEEEAKRVLARDTPSHDAAPEHTPSGV